jgi:hypothetical protein
MKATHIQVRRAEMDSAPTLQRGVTTTTPVTKTSFSVTGAIKPENYAGISVARLRGGGKVLTLFTC